MRRAARRGLWSLVGVVVAMIVALGVASPAGSMNASGRVSVRLTKTSFTAAQAAQVKLVYKFSSKSARFAYLLSRQQGTKWLKVRVVSKRGSFRGSHTITVKQLFGSKPAGVGRYRVKVSADANSVTRGFTVVSPPSGTNPPSGNPPSGAVVPVAGRWRSTGIDPAGMVTAISFTVLSDRATVYAFTFAYDYAGVLMPPFTATCTGSSETYPIDGAATPISNGQFAGPVSATGPWSASGPAIGSGRWAGTFDSPTSAHGTAEFFWSFAGGLGCLASSGTAGPFNWTAVPAQ